MNENLINHASFLIDELLATLSSLTEEEKSSIEINIALMDLKRELLNHKIIISVNKK